MASGLHAKSNISATRGRIDLSFFLFESYNAQVSSPKFSALYDISNFKKCRPTFEPPSGRFIDNHLHIMICKYYIVYCKYYIVYK